MYAGRLPSFWTKANSSGLLPGLDTACTHIHALLDAVFHHVDPLRVDLPGALCVTHRVAYTISKLWPLAANLTLGHSITPC
jgi:hypothetical protein